MAQGNVPPLTAERIERPSDYDEEFRTLGCCGEDPPMWAAQADAYLRFSALRENPFVLAFRPPDGRLVAATAFRPASIGLPLAAPVESAAWYLAVIGISREWQGQGLSTPVLTETFSHMKAIDPGREHVIANVHEENAPSLRACAKVGLFPLRRLDAQYFQLIGTL
jgi:RimJ/RimL family protein N-acetyltransferase